MHAEWIKSNKSYSGHSSNRWVTTNSSIFYFLNNETIEVYYWHLRTVTTADTKKKNYFVKIHIWN